MSLYMVRHLGQNEDLSLFLSLLLLTDLCSLFRTGTAPDIAGKGIVNPVGMILSVALMLRYSLAMAEEATLVEAAVSKVIEAGIRTLDLGGTAKFGDAVVAELV